MLRYTMKLHDDKTIEFEFLAEDDVRRQLDGACWTKTGIEYQKACSVRFTDFYVHDEKYMGVCRERNVPVHGLSWTDTEFLSLVKNNVLCFFGMSDDFSEIYYMELVKEGDIGQIRKNHALTVRYHDAVNQEACYTLDDGRVLMTFGNETSGELFMDEKMMAKLDELID